MKVMYLAEYLTHNQGLSSAGSLQCCYCVISTFIFNNTIWEGVKKTKRYLILEQNFFPVSSSKRETFPCFRQSDSSEYLGPMLTGNYRAGWDIVHVELHMGMSLGLQRG